ncbi:MAG: hypothetical protein NC310_06250 [Roseburia sp.]|nr:hypothetical protein [Anaeroplasma bactoclasticum]MCM1196651.1 hypothetical protein [Roseburia sp.]MCM1557682.1 hypothetical protein [Anaeroplasma bactoclasticum]
MKESKIIQTIILTVCVAFVMFLTIRLLPVNLKESLQAMADSVPDTDLEGESAMIYYGAAAFSIGITGIAMYVIAIFILIASLIMALFAVHNRNSNKNWIRYYNYALAFLSLFMFVSSIVKIILWRCGY